LQVRNLLPDRCEVRFSARSGFGENEAFSAVRTLALEGGGSAVVALPIPYSTSGLRLVTEIDGFRDRNFIQLAAGRSGNTAGPALLSVADRQADADSFARNLLPPTSAPAVRMPGGVFRTHTGSESARSLGVAVAELPREWTALSRFDAVAIDGGARELDAEKQAALSDWIFAGGTAFIIGEPTGWPSGPLKDLAADAPRDAFLTHGAGRSRRVTASAFVDRVAVDLRSVVAADPELAETAQRIFSGPPADAWFGRLEVPGIGRLPYRLFFGLTVAYLLFVAVRTQRILSARRPERLLTFIPLVGASATLAVLGYGAISEGLGTKSVERSFAVIDQSAKSAVVYAQRTLYAAFEPARLTTAPRTLLCSPETMRGVTSHHETLDGGLSVDGRLLPARTPTTVTTCAVADVRDRLRFRREPDGGLAVLAEAGFRPHPDLRLVVRDPAGAWFVGEGLALKPATAAQADRELRIMAERLFAMPTSDFSHDGGAFGGGFLFWRRYGYGGETDHSTLDSPEARQLGVERTLAAMRRTLGGPGWCGETAERPAYVDALGLNAERRAERHLVAARAAEDDFGR
jgi:hypothetical protein